MNRPRAVLVTALGAMTPALLLEERAKANVAQQTTVEVQRGISTIAPNQEAMKSTLLALSPAEKLRIAGDRIRLAQLKVDKGTSKRKGTKKKNLNAKTKDKNVTVNTYFITCWGTCK